MTITRSMILSTSRSNAQAHHAGECQCGCASCGQTCCQLDCIVQPRFFSGQLLTDQDLNQLLGWAQDKFRLSRYRHGWGVACGLEVHCDPKRDDHVIVGPGYAVDCCGDDIVVCGNAEVDLSAVCRDEQGDCADWKKPASGAPDVMIGDRPVAAGKLRIIDLYIQYRTEESDPQLLMNPAACRNASRCEPTRTRESFAVTWRTASADDPATAEANRWREAYGHTLDLIEKFTKRFPDLFSPKQATVRGEDVKGWLLCWIKDHPLHQFCFLRAQIEEMAPANLKKQDVITRLLFWMVQDYRRAFVSCACFGCEENHGVRLARVWIEADPASAKSRCRVLAIDPYPPFRRPLHLECGPAPFAHLNVGRFIGRRWQDAHCELEALGVHVSEVTPFVLPATLAALKDALTCDPIAVCVGPDGMTGNAAVAVKLYNFEGFGPNIAAICASDRTALQPPHLTPDLPIKADAVEMDAPRSTGVSVTKTSKEQRVKPGQPVHYVITLRNTGQSTLTLKLEDRDVTLKDGVVLKAGETQEFSFEDTVPKGFSGKTVTNIVTVTGKDADGTTVKESATHTIPVVG